MGKFRKTALAVLFGGLMIAPGARAAITGSNITTPADPSFYVADYDAPTQTFAVAGTTSGGDPSVDRVDIRCYYGTTYRTLAANVLLNLDGSFSLPTANLGTLPDRVCRLRAVPATTSPADLSPFAGPRIGAGERDTSTQSGGPNNGTVYDYYIYGQQLTGAFDYVSLGSCGLYDGYLYDATFAQTTTTFYCNSGLFSNDSATPTRSELRIDGVNAYPPYSAHSINPNATGLPAVTYSYSVDPSTGNLVIHETDPLVKCPDATYPPTVASCASFVSTGVTDNRTIVQDHDGHLSTFSDAFTSTDNGSHGLDLLWDNNQRFHGSSGDSTQLEYQFPGQSGFSLHTVGDIVSVPASAPGTIVLRMHATADGDPSAGQGAIVYDRPVDSGKFTYSSTSYQELTLHQAGTVPAGGATTFRFAYAHAYSSADVAALAQGAADQFGGPAVHITSPVNGTVVHTPSVAVGGSATDNVGVTSLTVNGAGVAVGAGGAWSTTVPLHTGANAITAVAHDGPGNAAQDQVTVTYQPTSPPPPPVVNCKVPKLKKKTLSAAKKALKKAHCGVGKVKKKTSKSIKKGRVISSSPKAGKTVAKGTKVKLTVSKGRH
jgi:hypothetical protein